MKLSSSLLISLLLVVCFCSCSNLSNNNLASSNNSSSGNGSIYSISNSFWDKDENMILGMALAKDSNPSIYQSPDAQSTMLIEISKEIEIPFYSVKDDWVLIEYENTRGWTNKNNLELVYSDNELISKIKAQDFVLKDINNKNN